MADEGIFKIHVTMIVDDNHGLAPRSEGERLLVGVIDFTYISVGVIEPLMVNDLLFRALIMNKVFSSKESFEEGLRQLVVAEWVEVTRAEGIRTMYPKKILVNRYNGSEINK